MQKILYIRIRIFLPPKLKILIYAYKKKKVCYGQLFTFNLGHKIKYEQLSLAWGL